MCLSSLAKEWWNSWDEAGKTSCGFVVDGSVPHADGVYFS